ncbi:tRNA (N6-threonylcarbamoyladenosine(37)-N6)-methyltransferase TrmO [Pseudocolwellia sp. AS88]|uniref:tRNA (N6-threonylcarbamoyladenosine(37)-N6)-methyltransferase TrmO n=1 Tax=Pseudocolwellia sp. AS88 TaxID=3063958 RepID=UPI0026F09125|nr:tRNA (N6-threonylcarbamoyladenosine(37)-N6)-methyltransferase TrmO [Pseudocolwellia sp. AS88]MDO7085778.1 tRNA (N6-threonylcarbamoyladenosine(37)-N6)-methyltransferase TrmO [Pseudocolwellia sp. AS88]
MPNSIALNYIGKVSSPYKEKFAIPRQPGLVSAAKGSITLLGDANTPELVRGLEAFSHIWVIFIFHGTQEQGWKPLVRPPRLGGNAKIGALATRSTFRPNPVGMSVVKLDSIDVITNKDCPKRSKNVVLSISGLDLLDGTPVIDIKPYIPYSDALVHAQASYAQETPKKTIMVSFSDEATSSIQYLNKTYPELENFIAQILEQDPRPAYKQNKQDDKIYGMLIYDLNVQWQFVSLSEISVINISRVINHIDNEVNNDN